MKLPVLLRGPGAALLAVLLSAPCPAQAPPAPAPAAPAVFPGGPAAGLPAPAVEPPAAPAPAGRTGLFRRGTNRKPLFKGRLRNRFRSLFQGGQATGQ